MDKLNVFLHSDMTMGIIKKLNQNKMFTINDFLQEDPEKLANVTALDISRVLSIREGIFKKYSAPIINGITFLNQCSTKERYLATGITSLDTLLNGGIPIGFITEICGLADSGKSQLCMQLAVNCVKKSQSTVLYIDTKGDFSATRIQKALAVSGISQKDMAVIMYKIKIVHVWSMEELIHLLEEVKNKKIVLDRLVMIIIDSLPCLMFQHFGDDNKIGLKLLNIFTNHARYLGREHEISFVCVNIETRWINQDNPDTDDDLTSKDTVYIEKKNRCLGKYWRQIPLLVLYLQKPILSSHEDCIKINVKVHNYNKPYKNIQCDINLSAYGVT